MELCKETFIPLCNHMSKFGHIPDEIFEVSHRTPLSKKFTSAPTEPNPVSYPRNIISPSIRTMKAWKFDEPLESPTRRINVRKY